MEQSKKVYFDSTLYIDSKTKDKNYMPNNNLIVGTDNNVPPSIYKSILKFNSNDWNFNYIDSVYLFIFLEKIDFKYSYNGNISILCYQETINTDETLKNNFSKYNSSKRLNLTFPPKAIERYIKIDITSVFTSIYSLNKDYNLILEPYFNNDNENPTSLIEFLSNNSKMPPYLIINGIVNEHTQTDLIKDSVKPSYSEFLTELKELNNDFLSKISCEINKTENFNDNLLNENKNLSKILKSEIMTKKDFFDFISKMDTNAISISNLNENIISNNSLILSLKTISEKNNDIINKIFNKLNANETSINNLGTKIKNIELLASNINNNLNENNNFISTFSEQINNNTTSINTLSTNTKNIDSIISSLATSINTTNNFIKTILKEIDTLKLSINDLNTQLFNTDFILSSLDNCSNNTLEINKQLKDISNCILSFNDNTEIDNSILENLNSSIDKILKFTENITISSLD